MWTLQYLPGVHTLESVSSWDSSLSYLGPVIVLWWGSCPRVLNSSSTGTERNMSLPVLWCPGTHWTWKLLSGPWVHTPLLLLRGLATQLWRGMAVPPCICWGKCWGLEKNRRSPGRSPPAFTQDMLLSPSPCPCSLPELCFSYAWPVPCWYWCWFDFLACL